MTDATMLINADRAYVVAPAGCGKTQLIAEAVRLDTTRRSLVLTHTYAGVDALRKRLKLLGAASNTYEVNTIAGWSLRLTTSFPYTSGIKTRIPIDKQWNDVYIAAANLLSIKAIKKVVQASYASIYVDEYQDCTILQHEIILNLANILPTRILGDPLQGIFDFGDEQIVNWKTHVETHYKELPPLNVPHRWIKKNSALGEWLLKVRKQLEKGEDIDLRDSPKGVQHIALPVDARLHNNIQREVCIYAKSPVNEKILAIHSWEQQCHEIARKTGGKFKSIETIECNELFKAAKAFDNATDGPSLAKAVFDFSGLCLTKVNSVLRGPVTRIINGGKLQKRQYKYQAQIDSIYEVLQIPSLSSVKKALLELARTPNSAVVRHELYYEMLKALKEFEVGKYVSLEEAAIRTRDRTRRFGRAPGQYVISRTLLIKGLEFDHAIILDANRLNRKNLYVAMTRASQSLKILSTSPILKTK